MSIDYARLKAFALKAFYGKAKSLCLVCLSFRTFGLQVIRYPTNSSIDYKDICLLTKKSLFRESQSVLYGSVMSSDFFFFLLLLFALLQSLQFSQIGASSSRKLCSGSGGSD